MKKKKRRNTISRHYEFPPKVLVLWDGSVAKVSTTRDLSHARTRYISLKECWALRRKDQVAYHRSGCRGILIDVARMIEKMPLPTTRAEIAATLRKTALRY